ncbi:MAG: Ada metal-binding domain-containing protein [bacterium]|nr:Ada metal-binding domain-containing protein [bacterium]
MHLRVACRLLLLLALMTVMPVRLLTAETSALEKVAEVTTKAAQAGLDDDYLGNEPYEAENFYFKVFVMPEVSLGEAAIEVVGKSGPFFGIDYVYAYQGFRDGSIIFTPTVLTPPFVVVTDIYVIYRAGSRFQIAVPSLSDYGVPSLGGYGYASIGLVSLTDDMRLRLGRPTDLKLPAGVYEKASGCAYTGSRNTHVFHRPGCRYVKQIKPVNRVCFKARKNAVNAGYRPCKVCRP